MVRLGEFNLGPLQGTHLMNNQIKYLAIKAGLDIDGFGYPIWGSLESEDAKKEFLEKFAMSIIRECLGQVEEQYKLIAEDEGMMSDHRWAYYVDCGVDCGLAIKEHFGVSDERTN